MKSKLTPKTNTSIDMWKNTMSKSQDKKWDKSVGLKQGSAMDRRLDALLKVNKSSKKGK